MKAPYKAIPELKAHLNQWLFNKGSILRMIDNSEVLRKFFVEDQRRSGMSIIKNFGYAPQRFNSHSEPLAKYMRLPASTITFRMGPH